MANLEAPMFIFALACIGLSIIFSVWSLVAARSVSAVTNSGRVVNMVSSYRLPGYITLVTTIASIMGITLSLVARATITGHGPFSNMYEFATAFSWGILVVGLFFWWRYRLLILTTTGAIIALALMIFAHSLPSQTAPLVPALQQSLLLTTHVASAVISYGAFTIGFASAILFLIRGDGKTTEGSESGTLDSISYHAVMIGFPFMTLVIVLGALWADIAWGKYWSWDPKETASLVTWLLYAAYLHARVMRGWKGRRAAILLIIGFAAVIFTFFGNYVFAGLHSYR
jgi:cytochrome c-type biogenesis protein CcsB